MSNETKSVTMTNQGYSFEYALETETGEKGARSTEKRKLSGYEDSFERAQERLKEAKRVCMEAQAT